MSETSIHIDDSDDGTDAVDMHEEPTTDLADEARVRIRKACGSYMPLPLSFDACERCDLLSMQRECRERERAMKEEAAHARNTARFAFRKRPRKQAAK